MDALEVLSGKPLSLMSAMIPAKALWETYGLFLLKDSNLANFAGLLVVEQEAMASKGVS